MKVELIIPIDSLRGKLRQDGFYFRKYRGQQIVQKCPDRSRHVKTESEVERAIFSYFGSASNDFFFFFLSYVKKKLYLCSRKLQRHERTISDSNMRSPQLSGGQRLDRAD